MTSAGTARRYAARLPRGERREQLLDAALRVVARDGLRRISIESIAREAGVSRPVVYDAFGDLDDLLRTLLDREEERALAELAAAIPPVTDRADPDELVTAAIQAFLYAVAANPDRWRLIVFPATGMPAVMRDRIARDRDLLMDQLAGLASWAIDARGGPPGLDPQLTAHLFAASAEELARLMLAEPERWTAERLAGFASDFLGALKRG